MASAKAVMDNLTSMQSKPDCIELTGISVASKLRKISDQRKRAFLEIQIDRLLNDALLEQLNSL